MPIDNQNLISGTRELWLRSVVRQVFMTSPLLARLMLKKKINMSGTAIKRTVDMAEIDDQAQSYIPGEKLTDGKRTFLDTPEFGWKYFQVPMTVDVEEELHNGSAGETQIVNFKKMLVDKGQRAARLRLVKMAYGTDTSDAAYEAMSDPESVKSFLGLRNALIHDLKYGKIERSASASTNEFWQGASIGGTYDDYDTSRSPSIDTFRNAKNAISVYADGPQDLLCLVGFKIFDQLRSQIESRKMSTSEGMLAKYGFESFKIDGVEIVKDEFLSTRFNANADKWMFLLNVNDWELRLHPQRSFKFTDFFHQANLVDGVDEWLARIMMAGNLVCWKPNGSIYLSNVA